MAKVRREYVCENCGHSEPKWLGRCPGCEAWSTMLEQVVDRKRETAVITSAAKPLRDIVGESAEGRMQCGIEELDRVLGGGIVDGSLILVGGDPGIGKSTLLLQAVGALSENGVSCLYMSAEESPHQVKMRAERLGVADDNLFLLADTHIESFERACSEVNATVCVVDSVQTVGMANIESAVGSVSQIRAVTHRLMEIAKGKGIAIFVVGHVTKEGAIAGPKVMEHMVDTVLYFEGERTGPYRILRAHKNRFGSAQEIGVFEMHASGLQPVGNPSELFLSQRATGPGAAVVTSVEGSRPILLEVQALATPSVYGTPRRTTLGFDPQRVAMLCAVLGARAGIDFGSLDVYVNVAGGVRVTEPAADLGVVMALASAVSGHAVPTDMVVVGEVGLSGEIRACSQLPARVQEAAALGFSRCLVPTVEIERWKGDAPAMPLEGVATVAEALEVAGLLPGTGAA